MLILSVATSFHLAKILFLIQSSFYTAFYSTSVSWTIFSCSKCLYFERPENDKHDCPVVNLAIQGPNMAIMIGHARSVFSLMSSNGLVIGHFGTGKRERKKGEGTTIPDKHQGSAISQGGHSLARPFLGFMPRYLPYFLPLLLRLTSTKSLSSNSWDYQESKRSSATSSSTISMSLSPIIRPPSPHSRHPRRQGFSLRTRSVQFWLSIYWSRIDTEGRHTLLSSLIVVPYSIGVTFCYLAGMIPYQKVAWDEWAPNTTRMFWRNKRYSIACFASCGTRDRGVWLWPSGRCARRSSSWREECYWSKRLKAKSRVITVFLHTRVILRVKAIGSKMAFALIYLLHVGYLKVRTMDREEMASCRSK